MLMPLLAVVTTLGSWCTSLAASSPRVITGASVGTAILIAQGPERAVYLTCEHVIRGESDIQLEFQNSSKSLPARVVAQNRIRDLAILEVSQKPSLLRPLPVAELGQHPKKYPAELLSWGYDTVPGRFSPATLLGKKLLTHRDESAFTWEIRERPGPGRSGGPVVNANGQILGIVAASRKETGLVIHHDEILAFLKQNTKALQVGSDSLAEGK
jgi:S1-C subfamily serine protease